MAVKELERRIREQLDELFEARPPYTVEVMPGREPGTVTADIIWEPGPSAEVVREVLKRMAENGELNGVAASVGGVAVRSVVPQPEGSEVIEERGNYQVLRLPSTRLFGKRATVIRCLICGRTSHHPEDLTNKYCGKCGWLTPEGFDPRLAPAEDEGHAGPGEG